MAKALKAAHIGHWLVLAALVLCCGCGRGLIATAGRGRSGPAADGVILGPGRTGSVRQVPWQRIGPGWALTEDSAASFSRGPLAAGPTTIFLIDPSGGRYAVHTFPRRSAGAGWLLLAWSGRRSALFDGQGTFIHELNLATGGVSSFRLPRGVSPIGYTLPGAQGIVAAGGGATNSDIARYDLAGQLRKVLANGSFDSEVAFPAHGNVLAIGEGSRLVLIKDSGGIVRTLPVAGRGADCSAVRWWAPGVVLATCESASGNSNRLWLVPASGAKPRLLTRSPGQAGAGYVDAWQLPGALYLQGPGGCGQRGPVIARQVGNKPARVIKVPGATDATIVTATRTRLLVQRNFCPGQTSLAWFNPVTRKLSVVVPTVHEDIGAYLVVPYFIADRF